MQEAFCKGNILSCKAAVGLCEALSFYTKSYLYFGQRRVFKAVMQKCRAVLGVFVLQEAGSCRHRNLHPRLQIGKVILTALTGLGEPKSPNPQALNPALLA